MKAFIYAAAAVALLVGAPALAQSPPPAATEVGIGKLALTNLPAKGGAKLAVTTPAFKDGADIPFENTQYRGNVFPGLAWSAGPAGTKSYAVIMQDTDAMVRDNPILHWTMANIPASASKLDAAMSAPQAGAAAYQRGPSGKLAWARIYDDVQPPAALGAV